jgi:prepilin-type processing-associated H-X9-DG protein
VWKPKKIESIKFASAEYSVGDAWYRRVAQATRRGTTPKREFLGTFPAINSESPLPSAPYHLVDLARVRSTRNQPTGSGILPKIEFRGMTNLSYLDGHAAGYRGRWQEKGEGGTVNPFWALYGGRH